jgi:beta-lactamase regulating signal transducer with metallopeptidase domain
VASAQPQTPTTPAGAIIDAPSASTITDAATGGAARTTEAASLPSPSMSVGTVLLLTWGGVAVILLGRLLLGMVAVRRIVQRATPLDAPEWRELHYEIADRLGLEEAPVLLKSTDIQMPFAAGLRRATIVLPAECDSWTAAQRDAVLIHELGHVLRRDLVGHTVGRIACAVYWFHPLVWTAARRLRDASERACDDLAIRLGARPSEYAQHLLDIVTNARQVPTPTAAIAMARRKEFEGRMLAILDPALRRDAAPRWRTAALSVTLAAFVVLVSAASPSARAASLSSDLGTGEASPLPVPSVESNVPEPNVPARDAAERQESVLPEAAEVSRAPDRTIDRFLQERAREYVARRNGEVVNIIDSDKMDVLIRILREDSAATVRRVAAWGLERYAGEAAAQTALARALDTDRDDEVREMAAWALGHAGTPLAIEALRRAFTNDGNSQVREYAVWGLGNAGDAGSASLIADRLGQESSADVRGTAAWALGQMGRSTAPRALIAMLEEPSESNRLFAAWALSQIGDSTALPAIRRALEQPQDESTMRALLRAVITSGASTESLGAMISSSSPAVRAMAVRAMTGGGAAYPWPWPWPRPIVYP